MPAASYCPCRKPKALAIWIGFRPNSGRCFARSVHCTMHAAGAALPVAPIFPANRDRTPPRCRVKRQWGKPACFRHCRARAGGATHIIRAVIFGPIGAHHGHRLACRQARKWRPALLRKQPDAAWRREKRHERPDGRHRARTLFALGRHAFRKAKEKYVPKPHRRGNSKGGSSPLSNCGALAHRRCHEGTSLSFLSEAAGSTSVVSGPPPRSEVRWPAPPAGA